MNQHIIDFLKFLESKGEKRVPLEVKLLYPDKFSPITKEDLTVKGSLDLSDSTIESLPDNLTIGRNLWLSDTKIKSLPDNLTVGGGVYLAYTEIESIPNKLKVGENLYLWDTPLASKMTKEKIKQEIERKGGYVKDKIHNTRLV